MTHRVFDTGINKLFGVYETEQDAMTLVRSLVGSNDDDVAHELAVSRERPGGTFDEPLSGAELLHRAEALLGGT